MQGKRLFQQQQLPAARPIQDFERGRITIQHQQLRAKLRRFGIFSLRRGAIAFVAQSQTATVIRKESGDAELPRLDRSTLRQTYRDPTR